MESEKQRKTQLELLREKVQMLLKSISTPVKVQKPEE